MNVTLLPAYGRDYKNKESIQKDWDANKDFVICCYGHPYDSKYINKADASKTDDTYSVRYDNQRKVCVLE